MIAGRQLGNAYLLVFSSAELQLLPDAQWIKQLYRATLDRDPGQVEASRTAREVAQDGRKAVARRMLHANISTLVLRLVRRDFVVAIGIQANQDQALALAQNILEGATPARTLAGMVIGRPIFCQQFKEIDALLIATARKLTGRCPSAAQLEQWRAIIANSAAGKKFGNNIPVSLYPGVIQPIALTLAATPEAARHSAALIIADALGLAPVELESLKLSCHP